eukprot:1947033-Alexandrium_andersonii.AAC.1
MSSRIQGRAQGPSAPGTAVPWSDNGTWDGDVEPHPGPGARLTATARAAAAEAARRTTRAMAYWMSAIL